MARAEPSLPDARLRLVVDASTLVAEGFRVRGRALLGHPSLHLVIAPETLDEAEHELRKRADYFIARRVMTASAAARALGDALTAVRAVAVVPAAVYADALEEARRRIPRDPRDAPTVALALTLERGILTGDYDFFGCGVPVWTVETLRLHLDAAGSAPRRKATADE